MAVPMKGAYRIFVFVDTDPERDENVVGHLLKFEEVEEVHYVSGQYDLLAVVEIDLRGKAVFSSVQELSQQVIQKIRKIKGVRDTNTLVPFLSLSRHPP